MTDGDASIAVPTRVRPKGGRVLSCTADAAVFNADRIRRQRVMGRLVLLVVLRSGTGPPIERPRCGTGSSTLTTTCPGRDSQLSVECRDWRTTLDSDGD